jgi:hypothetical protein
VLRDAMDIDELKSPALYFGTTTGQRWIGRDGGEKWDYFNLTARDRSQLAGNPASCGSTLPR